MDRHFKPSTFDVQPHSLTASREWNRRIKTLNNFLQILFLIKNNIFVIYVGILNIYRLQLNIWETKSFG